MKKYIITPVVAYVVVCMVAVLSPASEGYDVFTWKLLVGQVYAIPVLIITAVISYLFYRSDKK